jgi:uncharacterized protein DUF3489
MPKLTDSQLVILSAAAERDGGAALPLPKSLKFKGAAVTRMLNGLRRQSLLEEKPAPHDAIAWREGKDGGRMMLVITAAGLKALDDETAGKTSRRSRPTKSRAKKARPETKAADAQGRNRKQPTSRAGTKQGLLIDLLKRKSGATIDEIVTATGWQPHSVRGAISGSLKKKLGLVISSEKVADRGRVYRIGAQS